MIMSNEDSYTMQEFNSYFDAVVALAVGAGFNAKFIDYYKLDIKDHYYDGLTPQECFEKEFYNGEDFELKSVLY